MKRKWEDKRMRMRNKNVRVICWGMGGKEMRDLENLRRGW